MSSTQLSDDALNKCANLLFQARSARVAVPPLSASMLWLARKMAEVGRPLQEGDLVMSGAIRPMVPARAGDIFTVEIQGFSLFTWRLS